MQDLWIYGVEDVATMRAPDFEGRTKTIHIRSATVEQLALADALAEAHDLDASAACDRALRCLVAHVIDTHQELSGTRERANVTTLVPRRGWVADHRGQVGVVNIEPRHRRGHSKGNRLTTTVPPTVRDLIDETVLAVGVCDTLTAALDTSMRFLAADLNPDVLPESEA